MLGCPEVDLGEICEAMGQRAAVSSDPWVGAVQSLEDYERGIVNTQVPTMMVDNGTLTCVSDGNREEEISR